MNRPTRVAVIGTGKLGSRHADIYSKLPHVELVGICDVNEARAKEVSSLCKTTPYTNYRELLNKVDAASIVVPSHLHYEISKEFLKHNVNLLIEKPITTNLNEADKLLKLAHKNNLIIQVGHIERFNSAIRAIKGIIHKPRFIECHRLGPYQPRMADVGVTLDLMIHDIDIVLNVIKSPLKSINSVGAYIFSKTEDIANARMHFQNGCVCDLTASRVTPEVSRKVRIYQDNAYICIDYVLQEAETYTKEDGVIHHKRINITKSDSLKAELTDFIECVRHKRKPVVSGQEGRDALALALRISKQIQDAHS